MGPFARMDRLWKNNNDFIDYMSHHNRAKEIQQYDARIAALQAAKATLESQAVNKLSKRDFKTAEKLCKEKGWTKEDADYFVEDFLKRKPAARASLTRVATGLSQLSQAFMLA